MTSTASADLNMSPRVWEAQVETCQARGLPAQTGEGSDVALQRLHVRLIHTQSPLIHSQRLLVARHGLQEDPQICQRRQVLRSGEAHWSEPWTPIR